MGGNSSPGLPRFCFPGSEEKKGWTGVEKLREDPSMQTAYVLVPGTAQAASTVGTHSPPYSSQPSMPFMVLLLGRGQGSLILSEDDLQGTHDKEGNEGQTVQSVLRSQVTSQPCSQCTRVDMICGFVRHEIICIFSTKP